MPVKDKADVAATDNEGDTMRWLNSFVERRKERRVRIEFPATLFWTDENDEETVEQAYTMSVSNGGASFLVRRSLPVGANIKVIMHIGSNSGLALAEIKWTIPLEDAFRIGVSFKPEADS